MSEDGTLNQLTLFAEDFPAKTYQLPESARAFLESEADFGLNSIEFLKNLSRDGLLLKMSPACYLLTGEGILPPSFKGWSNSGIACAGGSLTFNTTEFPSDAAVCSLSEVLEMEIPQKYYLKKKVKERLLKLAKLGDQLGIKET